MKTIKLKDIKACPWNTRGEIAPESVKELAESISEVGLINPITLWESPQGEVYCVAGNRRLAALKSLGLEIEDDDYALLDGVTENDARMVTVTENLQREDVGIIEEAALVQQCLDSGMTADAISAKTGRSLSWVNRRRKLVNLGEAWKSRKDIDADALEKIASYPADVQERASKKVGGGCHSWRDMSWAFNSESKNLDAVKFDRKACKKCEMRTGAQADLWGECDGGLGMCLDCKCFAKKLKDYEDKQIANATDGAEEVVRVKYSWELDSVDDAKDKRDKKHPCAYVYVGCDGEVEVKWGASKKEQEAKKKREAEAREAEDAERAKERARENAITDKLDEWKDGADNDEYPQGLAGLISRCLTCSDRAERNDFVIDAVADSIVGWHNGEEWARILTAFPEIAEFAGVGEDDVKYLVCKYKEENEK